jgi:hypothetical protein
VGEIIPVHRATSSRNQGRHHLGLAGRHRRNPQAGGSFNETFSAVDPVAGPDANPAGRSKSGYRGYRVGRPIIGEASAEVHIELKVMLPRITIEQFRQRGALRGISSSTLAEKLLVTIGRDGLYDAVLDGG